MQILKLIFKNLFRDKLRTFLTVSGIVVAIVAFVLLRTFVTAWYSGIEASSQNRLIIRHSVSFMFPLPISYKNQIETLADIERVTYATWFQGVYIDERHSFPRLAVEVESYFDIHPEYVVDAKQFDTFKKERDSCIIGQELAQQYNIKEGDAINISGDLYPGDWKFVVRGVFQAADQTINEKILFFHSEYLEQSLKQSNPEDAGQVGWYEVRIKDAEKAAQVSESIDKLFKNSPAETKTETEQAFRQNVIAMSNAIISSLEYISYVIVGIVFLVLANTISMSAREKTLEYGVMKTIGYNNFHVAILIIGEAILLALIGGGIGLALSFPLINDVIAKALAQFMPIFHIATSTQILAIAISVSVGILAALVPTYRATRIRVVDALKNME